LWTNFRKITEDNNICGSVYFEISYSRAKADGSFKLRISILLFVKGDFEVKSILNCMDCEDQNGIINNLILKDYNNYLRIMFLIETGRFFRQLKNKKRL
jgi:hypothetical protein